jgi:hypothetical protein
MNKKSYLILSLIIASTIFATSCGSSKVNTDASKHFEMIASSRINKDVVVSLDTVYFKGEPYSLLKMDGISFSPFYHFSTITGEKAFDVLPYSSGDGKTTDHHEFIFFGNSTGMRAYANYSFTTIGVCETVINNNLLSPTSLKSIDVGNFVKNNPRPAKFNPGALKVRREMTKEVKINQGYGDITQGGISIAKFDMVSDRNDKMITTKNIYRVRFLNGTQAAVVTISADKQERQKNKYMEAFTEFDGKTHNLTIEPANTDWDIDAFKQAVLYLINNGYL